MNATFYPSFRFRDADAEMQWLGETLGFEPGGLYRDDAGRIRHGELWLDGAAIMFGEGDPADGQSGVYIAIDDVDGLYERARAAGAEFERELQDTDYGSREFAARDPEGVVWSFGSYRATRE